jgi:hypothetical protein
MEASRSCREVQQYNSTLDGAEVYLTILVIPRLRGQYHFPVESSISTGGPHFPDVISANSLICGVKHLFPYLDTKNLSLLVKWGGVPLISFVRFMMAGVTISQCPAALSD